MTHFMSVEEPLNFEKEKDHKEWTNAMKEKYDSIMKNETWKLTKLPKNKILISSKWLFKSKLNVDGSIDKFKARLVAKCYSQKERKYYGNMFSPIVKMNTIRLMIALAIEYSWKLHELDVKSSFLNGELKK
jgi:hypothetical protein